MKRYTVKHEHGFTVAGVKMEDGDHVFFDGVFATHNGGPSFEAPFLRGAIKAGWLVEVSPNPTPKKSKA